MKIFLFLLVFFVLFLTTLIVFHRSRTYPHTNLSRQNVSLRTKKEIGSILDKFQKQTLKIQVKDRIYEYPYHKLGISLNKEVTMSTLFEPNTLPFPQNIQAFFSAAKSQRLVLPTLVFDQDFYRFAHDSIFDFSLAKDEMKFDPEIQSFIYEEKEEKYRIDPENLRTQIVFNFGQPSRPLIASLIKVENEKKKLVHDYNEKITGAFSQPVTLLFAEGPTRSALILDPPLLKKVLSLSYQPQNEKLDVSVQGQVLAAEISRHYPSVISNTDKRIDEHELEDNLKRLMQTRFEGASPDTLVAPITFQPNSDGKVAQKYIEVDISQQRMFLFENGVVKTSYRISSGLYYPTPRGQFKIMNKALNAYSDIYNVWMPYWMAFYYDPKLNAYFGIHELPYWVSSDGQKIQRPRDFIGSPHTGGCISLDIGAAKEVQDFAEIGMPVMIFD